MKKQKHSVMDSTLREKKIDLEEYKNLIKKQSIHPQVENVN